jgi:hypothetical protein
MPASNWVHLEECKILSVRGKAIQIEYQHQRIWLPKSQISEPELFQEGDYPITVSITEWIAAEKGLESGS